MMQAGKDYGVEVVVAYEQRRVGQVFYPPGALRQALVRCGLVRALTAKDEASQADLGLGETRAKRRSGRAD